MMIEKNLFFQNQVPYISDVEFWVGYTKPKNLLKSYLHLLLPINCPESIEINYNNGVAWREGFANTTSLSLHSLHELVCLNKTNTDFFFNLTNPSTPLVKPTQSGSTIFFYGSDLLYNLPLVFTRKKLTPEELGDVSALIHSSLKIDNKISFLLKNLHYANINYSCRGRLLEIFTV